MKDGIPENYDTASKYYEEWANTADMLCYCRTSAKSAYVHICRACQREKLWDHKTQDLSEKACGIAHGGKYHKYKTIFICTGCLVP